MGGVCPAERDPPTTGVFVWTVGAPFLGHVTTCVGCSPDSALVTLDISVSSAGQ